MSIRGGSWVSRLGRLSGAPAAVALWSAVPALGRLRAGTRAMVAAGAARPGLALILARAERKETGR
jgi:hypothetical protein